MKMITCIPDLKKDKEPSVKFLVDFFDTNKLQPIIIVNGFVDYSKPYLWEQNARVREIEITFMDNRNNSITQAIELEDTPNPQIILCPSDFTKKKVNIKIKETYKGTKYSDVAISYIGYTYENE